MVTFVIRQLVGLSQDSKTKTTAKQTMNWGFVIHLLTYYNTADNESLNLTKTYYERLDFFNEICRLKV